MLKYLLLTSIILLYATLLLVEFLFIGDMIYRISILCSHFISILLGVAILAIRSLGKIWRNILAGIVMVVSLWFVFNYIYVIVSDTEDEVHLKVSG